MKRSSPSLQFLATAAASSDATTTMSFRPTPAYRGGRNQWRRGFYNHPYGAYNDQYVTGDSHFQSVRDANRGFRPHPRPPPFNYRPTFDHYSPPPYNQNQPFRPPGPPPLNQNQPFPPRGPPPFQQNQQFWPPDQLRRRPPKPLDYRNWEYAKPGPPPSCERFTVLSYNILADYLAINHRSKLYFHIPRHILDWEFRKRNIIFELGLWSADILCFQEVDRYQDFEEELKLRGYSGIWKMRTGDPVDGCAIFWRASRFKLLHEEFIEFSKLGLRDNVAQICVLESMNQSNNICTSALPASSQCPNRVVVCNVHVLYNPKRGDIKLGQVRVLLDRAHAVSKLWDDAPVVLCGDFNCTPKSSLYNFISEQKLDVSELPRDKISGQASAEIRPRRPFIPNLRAHSTDNSTQSPTRVGDKEVGQNDTLLDLQKKNSLESNLDNIPSTRILTQPQTINTEMNMSVSPSVERLRNDEDSALSYEPVKGVQVKEDVCKDETELTLHFQVSGSNESPSVSHNEDTYPDIDSGSREETRATSNASYGSSNGHSQSNLHAEIESLNCEKGIDDNRYTDATIRSKHSSTSNLDITLSESSFSDILEISPPDSSENLSSPSVTNDKDPFIYEVDFSYKAKGANFEQLSPNELGEATDDGSLDEDSTTFLSELHNTGGPGSSEFSEYPRSDFVDCNESPKDCVGIPEVLDDSSGIDCEPFDVKKPTYDPSAWTPMEIETATGNSECTFMEHPIKLRSTYSEVEDFSGTRDSYGKPQVTSYHRGFSGTVDYIWWSEGLQTVRVLAPIPRHAMQWTPGFPTKKWGSDHIALVTELAFRKDVNDQNAGSSVAG